MSETEAMLKVAAEARDILCLIIIIPQSLEDIEKTVILKTLEMTKQNRTHAADHLGISIRCLRDKIRKYREGK